MSHSYSHTQGTTLLLAALSPSFRTKLSHGNLGAQPGAASGPGGITASSLALSTSVAKYLVSAGGALFGRFISHCIAWLKALPGSEQERGHRSGRWQEN